MQPSPTVAHRHPPRRHPSPSPDVLLMAPATVSIRENMMYSVAVSGLKQQLRESGVDFQLVRHTAARHTASLAFPTPPPPSPLTPPPPHFDASARAQSQVTDEEGLDESLQQIRDDSLRASAGSVSPTGAAGDDIDMQDNLSEESISFTNDL